MEVNKYYQCYAILSVQDGYYDYLGYIPQYKKEFFNITDTGFDTSNTECLIAYIQEVLKVEEFEIYWTFLDPDHFCEIHNLCL